MPSHSSGSLTPVCHHGGPGIIPGWSMWDLCWAKWQWDRFFTQNFSFPWSVSFDQQSTLTHSFIPVQYM